METSNFSVPLRVAELMQRFERPWFIAGGWALDLYLGRVTRHHKDCEIAILRRDQQALRDHMAGWEFSKVEKGELLPWPEGEQLQLPTHEIHARREGGSLESLEVLLNEGDEALWQFRKNPAITRPMTLAAMRSAEDIPFLAPEIVLLYKAFTVKPRPEDRADYETVSGTLDEERCQWLWESIRAGMPGHPWLDTL